MDKAHNLLGGFFRLNGVIRYAELQQHIREAHYAKTDFAGLAGVFVDFGQGIAVHINDVVKEVNGGADNAGKSVVINGGNTVILRNAKPEVD